VAPRRALLLTHHHAHRILLGDDEPRSEPFSLKTRQRRDRATQEMRKSAPLLANRLGVTTHVSPLRFRLTALQRQYPSADAACLEDWLIDVANARGARIVSRDVSKAGTFSPPPEDALSNSELVVAICQPQCLDRPHMLRLAAQLISRKAVRVSEIELAARRERAGRVLAELARQVLKVEPDHEVWRAILDTFGEEHAFREPILHWTRLAEPVMRNGRCNASEWRLVR